jgi:lipase maturation factor 1
MSHTLMHWLPSAYRWLFHSDEGAPHRLIPRWLFLRALGCIYFSAFYSLIFQIRGLIGPQGILPASDYLKAAAQSLGPVSRVWYVPSLLWLNSGSHMLTALCAIGMLASLLLVLNIWPRATLLTCFACYLSFVAAAQDFSGYQSDGMLLEAGFIALFFAPSGLRPRFGQASPPQRAALFLLQWEWFRIYFESGAAKILGGDPEWRNFTAMDEYYQNGPLPTWIGWYMQHLPHWFHASATFATLALELVLVWMLFLPRRWRIACFLIVTPWQLVVILTANYTFLNYLVLSLGILLLDDRPLRPFLPQRWKKFFPEETPAANDPNSAAQSESQNEPQTLRLGFRHQLRTLKTSAAALLLTWVVFATTVQLLWMFWPLPFPTEPVALVEPFRIANRYGLFGIMTRGRYEIEFQGSDDGKNWAAYPFRYKPQNLNEPPGMYAPYQPRFDWNLWFASLGSWREYPIVPNTEVRLLSNDEDVLALFKSNPFPKNPPHQVRAILYQYWFTSMSEEKKEGLWWRREYRGLYAPTLQRAPDGTIQAVEWPTVTPRE